MNVPTTSAAPITDLAARLAAILDGLSQAVAAEATRRWGLAPLLLWIIRPHLRRLATAFEAVVADALKSGMARPDPLATEASPRPAHFEQPLTSRTAPAVTQTGPGPRGSDWAKQDGITGRILRASCGVSLSRCEADWPSIRPETFRSAASKPAARHELIVPV